jgi:hypothetical protein
MEALNEFVDQATLMGGQNMIIMNLFGFYLLYIINNTRLRMINKLTQLLESS